jgi:D-serine deaminase-like pyridoxal phosphate-dependent protein
VVTEPNRAVIDCGMKGLSAQRGLSAVKDLDGIELKALHAEHGLLEISNADSRLNPGRRSELWVQYRDATVNLHRQMYGIRNGEVEEVFAIER